VKSAGHVGRSAKDLAFDSTIDDLCRQYVVWKHGNPDSISAAYNRACEMIAPRTSEHRALLSHPVFQADAYALKGLFISALDNAADEPLVCYQTSMPCNLLGYRSRRILVNRGVVGRYFAEKSSGISINLGTAGEAFGNMSEGININFGFADSWFACNARGSSLNLQAGTAHNCFTFSRSVNVLAGKNRSASAAQDGTIIALTTCDYIYPGCRFINRTGVDSSELYTILEVIRNYGESLDKEGIEKSVAELKRIVGGML
jgi:hypothetical protein